MSCLRLGLKIESFCRHGQSWNCTSGLPSDVTIEIREISFHLHKDNSVSTSADVDDNVFQLIQAHQNKASRLTPVQEVKTFLCYSLRGALSTFSVKHEGYPSGSMVDFACDAHGAPILAVSDLAVHTKNLMANPKCSLLVSNDPQDRTELVVTVHGDAFPVPEKQREEIRAMYLGQHPNAFWVIFWHSYKQPGSVHVQW